MTNSIRLLGKYVRISADPILPESSRRTALRLWADIPALFFNFLFTRCYRTFGQTTMRSCRKSYRERHVFGQGSCHQQRHAAVSQRASHRAPMRRISPDRLKRQIDQSVLSHQTPKLPVLPRFGNDRHAHLSLMATGSSAAKVSRFLTCFLSVKAMWSLS